MITIDDILRPIETERARLDAQMACVNRLLHALAPLDKSKSLEQAFLLGNPDLNQLSIGDANASRKQETEAARQERVRTEAQCRQSDVRPGLLRQQPDGSADDSHSSQGFADICHITGGEPRTGLNLVSVFGERIQVLVTREDHHEYIAQEVDYDDGRPTCCAHSPLQALRDLQSLLEDEHLRDCRRRDGEFARSVAKAELP